MDRPGAALTWEAANLPPPNLAIINPENGHAHLHWSVTNPIFIASGYSRHSKAARLLATVQAAMTYQLRADPSYSGFLTKNPLHPHWITKTFAPDPYSLTDLLDWLSADALQFAKDRTQSRDQAIGVGRNVALFDLVRSWAYRWVRTYRETASYTEWRAFVEHHASARNADFNFPLEWGEIRGIARSVARWTWTEYRPVDPAIQRIRGIRSGHKRRASGQERIKTAIAEIQSTGGNISVATIAAKSGMSERNIKTRYKNLITTETHHPLPPKPSIPHVGDIYPDMVRFTPREHGEHARIHELRAAGWTIRNIAAEVGRSVGHIHKLLAAKPHPKPENSPTGTSEACAITSTSEGHNHD